MESYRAIASILNIQLLSARSEGKFVIVYGIYFAFACIKVKSFIAVSRDVRNTLLTSWNQRPGNGLMCRQHINIFMIFLEQ